MGETTAVAHGGNPQDRAAFPRPRCIATPYSLLPTPCSLWYSYGLLERINKLC
ncbi:hypothetical protein [Moorena producens]|uniref:hypothetical protein n=1 Tax=Moorena producens TaxID=1155739 RepID=UPI003C72FA0E